MSNEVMSYTAWELIGFDGTTEVIDRNLGRNPEHYQAGYEAQIANVRVKGGRTLYESVGNNGGSLVRLSRLDTDNMRAVVRYIEPDTVLEVLIEEA